MTKKHTQTESSHPSNKQESANELEVCKQECQTYLNNWKRAEADFANYRKEEHTRVRELLKFGNERMVLDILDTVDVLDEAIRHAPEETDKKWFNGIRQVAKKFHELLAKFGVAQISTEGQQFNPLRHEAVGTVPGNGEAGKIVEVVRAGYEMHEKIIRPARVIVSDK